MYFVLDKTHLQDILFCLNFRAMPLWILLNAFPSKKIAELRPFCYFAYGFFRWYQIPSLRLAREGYPCLSTKSLLSMNHAYTG